MSDLLVRAAELSPGAVAFAMPSFRTTYEEVLVAANRVTRGLTALGVKPGDNVGILAPNSPEYVAALFGTVMLGAVAVPLQVRYKSDEVAYVVKDAELVALLTTDRIDDYSNLSRVILDAVPGLAEVAEPAAANPTAAPNLRSVAMLRGEGAERGVLAASEFEALANSLDTAVAEELASRVRVRDVAAILYTSGTTSRPKGVMLSHEAMTRAQLARAAERFASTADHEVYWIPGPLFHIGALSPMLGCVAAAGTTLTDVRFDPARAVGSMTEHRVTSAWPWYPYVTKPVIDHPDFDPALWSAVEFIGQVGPRGIFEQLDRTFPQAEIVTVSGMTEAAGTFAVARPNDGLETRIVAQGVPMDGIEAKIVEPGEHLELPAGEPGELMLRGYCITEGYFHDEVRTAAALTPDRWLRTGDAFSLTPGGSLVFHGRLKDMLKVGGENVAALEVEEFLASHEKVTMASVVGIPDEKLDEVPVAFVELEEGEALDVDELIAFCKNSLASYKIPRHVLTVKRDEWPMSATKVNKQVLRKLATEQLTSLRWPDASGEFTGVGIGSVARDSSAEAEARDG